MRYLAISLLIFSFVSFSCAQKDAKQADNPEYVTVDQVDIPESVEKISKSEKEWAAELTDNQFYILREKGTERAGTSALLDNKEHGVYTCAACGLPLFASDTKFKSGTGWPSFFKPIKQENVQIKKDYNLGMVREEVRCNRCGSHLGHVFEDGPKPTGLRYCMNSAALDFEKK